MSPQQRGPETFPCTRYLHSPSTFVTSPGTKKIKFLTRGALRCK